MADMWNKYEPTAARKRGKPGRDTRPKSTTIDMHAHVAVPRAAEIAGSHDDPKTVPLDYFSTPETKALMAKQGADKPRTPEQRRQSVNPQVERTTPRSYLREVQGEMKKVAWPPRPEILNSTVIVIIGVVVMTSLIFLFDWLAGGAVNHIFK